MRVFLEVSINIACPTLYEIHSLNYDKPTLPQAAIYDDKIGDIESE